jgi:hypothetical protein
MNRLLYASIIVLAMSNVAEAAEQFDQTACRAVKAAVELFLGLADTSFKEAERLRKIGDATLADAKFKEAFSMSELARNYSTVYIAFCKP